MVYMYTHRDIHQMSYNLSVTHREGAVIIYYCLMYYQDGDMKLVISNHTSQERFEAQSRIPRPYCCEGKPMGENVVVFVLNKLN